MFIIPKEHEFEKVLKSPYWVDYARKQGYTVEKPEEIINIFLDKKRQIYLMNYYHYYKKNNF